MTLIKLKSNDDQVFEADLDEVKARIRTVGDFVGDDDVEVGDNDTVPLPLVEGKELSRVVKFLEMCKSARRANTNNDDDAKMRADFVDQFDRHDLTSLTLAANYLNYDELLDATCDRIARMIRGKTPEEIRKEFNIENDLTPEEEERIKEENKWAFQ